MLGHGSGYASNIVTLRYEEINAKKSSAFEGVDELLRVHVSCVTLRVSRCRINIHHNMDEFSPF